MENLWPVAFEENNKPSAKNVLEEQAKLLPTLTKDMVYAEITPLSPLDAMRDSMENDFAFRFDLRGKFLENYRFSVLSFSHDITLYPVKFRLDEKIGLELGILRTPIRGAIKQIDTPELLEQFLASVLRTERVKSVVGSIIRMSR